MRRYTILIILISSFILNGCLADRIKQRLYAREYAKHTMIKHHNKKYKNIKVEESFSYAPKEEYIISAPTTTRSYTPTVVTKEKRVVKKYKKKKVIKKRIKKKRVAKKRIKKYKKIKKKISHEEPFSIKKDEADPELLGPQTTLKANPLVSKTN